MGLRPVQPGARALPLDRPTQVHLSQGDRDGSAITVSWMTTNVSRSLVKVGRRPGRYDRTYGGEAPAQRYHYAYAYQPRAYASGLVHHQRVSGLEYDTVYYYVCGSEEGGFSAERRFKTPPKPSAAATVTFAVVGDLGQTRYSRLNAQAMLADAAITSVVVVGDLSYADSAARPSARRPCSQRRWDSWFEMVEPLASRMPLMTCPGNHEIEADHPRPGTATPFLAYTARLRMPGANPLFYSYNYGPVHFLMLNNYMPYDEASPQYAFAAADLAAVDRAVTPWLLAAFHAPWYNSNWHNHNEMEEVGMREAMEDLFHRHQVDLVFSGHVHNYERMHPVYRGRRTPGAAVYINVGDGGNREGPALGFYPQPPWSAFRLAAELDPMRIFGHGKVAVHNRTHLHFTWHRLWGSARDLGDEVWLVRNGSDQGVPRRGLQVREVRRAVQRTGRRPIDTAPREAA